MIIFAPIKNFTCDVSVIDLGNSLSIAKSIKKRLMSFGKISIKSPFFN